MSRESQITVENFVNRMTEHFNKTPYSLSAETEIPFETKDQLLLSIVIPARNEFPNIVHTIHSMLNTWEGDGYDYRDLEIIVVNNCSNEQSTDDRYWTHPADYGTSTYMEARGIYFNRILRTLYDPVAGNHSARNKGAKIARGKYLMFSDAHMSYAPGFFKYMMQAVDESGGIAHSAVGWMGTFPPTTSSIGTQYTCKLGAGMTRGTWANYRPTSKTWFGIWSQGHCSLMMNRKQFLDFGGYPLFHRTYGGGEIFVDSLWWLYGSRVVCEPRAIGYHLKSGRGYSYNQDDFTSNVMNVTYMLGMDDWRERDYIDQLRKGRKEWLDKVMVRSQAEGEERRKEIEKRRIMTFNEMLLARPWDTLNDERIGAHNSSTLIYHDTWLAELEKSQQYVKDAYVNSKYQKGLEEFINKNLSQYVYKRANKEPAPLS